VTGIAIDARRRAEMLVRIYPKEWRERYGDEFAELLIAEVEEQPRSLRRTTNVVLSGGLARLTQAGLSGNALPAEQQARASLASFGCAFSVFLIFGIAIWAQLAIGWQWSRPNTSATFSAMIVLSLGVACFLVLAILGTTPIATHLVRRLVLRQTQGLARPLFLLVLGVAVLVVGSRHFGNGWPGTGGHPWGHQGIVPGGVAAFTWAMTLSVTSYWVHPDGLLTFPTAEIIWMLVSPIALVSAIVGAAKTVRRLDLPRRTLRFEMVLAEIAASIMIIFVGGAIEWVISGGAGPRNLFHIGAIDIAGIVAMTLAIAVAYRATHRARRVGLSSFPL
jgi:hypothetical protein